MGFIPCSVFTLYHTLPVVYKERNAFFFSVTINSNMYHRSNAKSDGRDNCKATQKRLHQMPLEESWEDCEGKGFQTCSHWVQPEKKAVFELDAALLWQPNSKKQQTKLIFICILLYANTPDQIHTS